MLNYNRAAENPTPENIASTRSETRAAEANPASTREENTAVSRRAWLRGGALLGAGALLSGCSDVIQRFTSPAPPASIELPRGETHPIARLLNRAAFGASPGEIARVEKIGAARYVEEQLNAAGDEPQILTLRLRGIEALQSNPTDLQNLKEREVLFQIQQAAILRATYSRHQLRERMIDFWSNHFNIYAREGHYTFYKPADEFGVIREGALGKFPDLLHASARSPAMLFYLNNDINKRGVPNENYARELMELHTMGVHGGYTQRDVQEVARCLTGWTVEERFAHKRGTFRFDSALHDDGEKIVLGTRIPAGGGESDTMRVLALLAKHPATAHHIAGKISRYFLGDAAEKWTGKLAAIYSQTGGDIKAMLRPLLLSDELRDGPPFLKRPFDFVISSMRALNADTDGGGAVQDHLAKMGQPLYQWPMPDGYPDTTAAWTGSLLSRWNFALALCGGTLKGVLGGTSVDLPALLSSAPSQESSTDALTEIILSRRNASDARGAAQLQRALSAMKNGREYSQDKTAALSDAAALLLASPDFQWR